MNIINVGYVDYSIALIKKAMESAEKAPEAPVIVRIQTPHSKPQPRIVKVVEIGKDFIVGQGRSLGEPEIFRFGSISSWRFAEYQPEMWKKGEE